MNIVHSLLYLELLNEHQSPNTGPPSSRPLWQRKVYAPRSTAVNRLSCPWIRKGPREHEHARRETHLRDLRARVANLYVYFVAGPMGAPAVEAAAHPLDTSGTGQLRVPRPRARPRFAAQTDGYYVASAIFALARKALAAARSRSRAPCFCLLNARRWRVHLTCSAWPLRGWERTTTPFLGTRPRPSPSSWALWRKRRDGTERKKEQEG